MPTFALQVHRVTLPSLVVLGVGDPEEGCIRLAADAGASSSQGQPRLLVLHIPHVEVRPSPKWGWGHR
jgi:hypothetical protein